MPIPDDLLCSHRTGKLLIELTTKCNLRCAYCAVAQPDYVGVQFPVEHFGELTELIVARRPERLMINGHGETTIVKNWDVGVRHWLERGLSLEIITNLSKKLKDHEIETLAQLDAITISTDSAQPELFEALRRNAKWEIFDGNLTRLLRAIAEQEHEPTVTFSTVVSDVCAPSLPGLVEYGLRRGVRHFEFCNLSKYPDVEGAIALKHISEMDSAALDVLRDPILRMLHEILEHGASFTCPEALAQSLDIRAPTREDVAIVHPVRSIAELVREHGASFQVDARPHADGADEEPDDEATSASEASAAAADAMPAGAIPASASDVATQGNASLGVAIDDRKVYPSRSDAKRGTMTRGCLDPWSFGYIQSNTAVRICCFSQQTVGHLGTRESLDEILNSEKVLAFRRGLLSGELLEDCENCWARPWVPVEQLEADVRAWTSV